MLLVLMLAGKAHYKPCDVFTGTGGSVTQVSGRGETAAHQRAEQHWLRHLSTKNIKHLTLCVTLSREDQCFQYIGLQDKLV